MTRVQSHRQKEKKKYTQSSSLVYFTADCKQVIVENKGERFPIKIKLIDKN